MEDTQNIEALNPRQLLDYKISRAKDDFKLEYAKGINDWWQCFATRVTGINTAFYKAKKEGFLTSEETERGSANMKSLLDDFNKRRGFPVQKTPPTVSLSDERKSQILNTNHQSNLKPPSDQEQELWFARLDILAEPEEQEMPKAA